MRRWLPETSELLLSAAPLRAAEYLKLGGRNIENLGDRTTGQFLRELADDN